MFSYLLALIFVKVLTAEEILLPDGRNFYLPNQEIYSYVLKNESPSSVERLYILSKQRNDVALICPKGYAILEMTQELVIPPNLRNLIEGFEIRHSASLHSKRRGKQKLPPCRTLYECLGYQACFFMFSHHLCFVNEALLSKSYLLLSIICFRDDLAVIPLKFKKQRDQILHFRSDIHGLGYSDTSKLSRLILSERDLFSGKCSIPDLAKESEGFLGTCLEQPIPTDSISENLFYLFARTHSKNCRMKLQQVYCALQYSKEGFCIPPIYINHKKSVTSDRIFSFQSLPKTGPRPSTSGYKKFLSERNEHLIPSRLAFVVLVYNDPQAAMDLIHSIYKEQFLYVIHVDEKQTIIRQNLIKMIEESRFPAHNVYILPLERSFITYPISYETVRAQLEGYEEILRLGVWDFAITLTENDVLMRSVDDLSMALAPHRGLSFVSFLRRKPEGENTSRLIENAYFPCDGFVYNVSVKYFDFSDKFQMFCSSSGIYSRQFIHYLVDENSRSSTVNKFQFYLQTDAAPVESYISTVLMNSPFKQYTRIASIHDLFDLDGNTNFSNSDYPLKEKESNPISKWLGMSHKSFFVRRNVKVRNDVLKYAQTLTVKEYYGFMKKYFPPIIVKVLSDRALEEISVKSMIPKEKIVFSSVLDIHVTPSLVPYHSSCNTEAFHEFNSNFNYWFDISVFNKVKYATEVIRLMLQPTIRTTHCFDDGVFKMLSILPWKSYEDHNSATDWLWFGMNNPLTFPYGPSFIKSISLNLYFSKEIENMENVLNDKRKENPFVFKRGSTIKVKSKLIAPDLSVCSTVSTITWSSLNSCPGNSNHTYIKTETPSMCLITIDVPCKKLGPGLWTLQIEKVEPSRSKLHSVSFYLLDLNNLDVLNEQLINFSLFWTLKGFAFITKNYTFNFQEQQGYTDEDLSLFEHNHVNALTLSGEESQPLNKYHQVVPIYRTNTQIFLCSGGFASTIIILLSVFWIYTWRYSFLQNILLFSILSLFLGMALQIVLFLTIC